MSPTSSVGYQISAVCSQSMAMQILISSHLKFSFDAYDQRQECL